jgi:PASTA domain
VADYVGRAAAGAAQAVRRSGLRPALERSPSPERARVGQVVAQEPAAGSDVPRNALVTLYVAAAPENVSANRGTEDEEQLSAGVEAERKDGTTSTTSARVSWRSTGAGWDMGDASGERVLSAPEGTRAPACRPEAEPRALDAVEEPRVAAESTAKQRAEELLDAAADLFARRGGDRGAAWRGARARSAPRDALHRGRAWLRRRSWISRAALAMLAAGALIGVANVAFSTHPSPVHRPPAAARVSARLHEVPLPSTRAEDTSHPEPRRASRRRLGTPRPRRGTSASVGSAPPPSASARPADAPLPAPGGPFSP